MFLSLQSGHMEIAIFVILIMTSRWFYSINLEDSVLRNHFSIKKYMSVIYKPNNEYLKPRVGSKKNRENENFYNIKIFNVKNLEHFT